MHRLRLRDCRLSRLPEVLGIDRNNVPLIAEYVNAAQRRLLYAPERPDTGWWGTWAVVEFPFTPESPTLVMPRGVAKIVAAVLDKDSYVMVTNPFYEFDRFGNSMLCEIVQTLDNILPIPELRASGTVATYKPYTGGTLKVRVLDDNDEQANVLFCGIDENSYQVYSYVDGNRVPGYLVKATKMGTTVPIKFKKLTAIQKDVTAGYVEIYEDDELIHIMEPSETVASYTQYHLVGIGYQPTYHTVKAVCQLDYIDVKHDLDFLVIQNLEAIIAECQSIMYDNLTTEGAVQMSLLKHKQAIEYLLGELKLYASRQVTVRVGIPPTPML